MSTILRHRGRRITDSDVAFIAELISSNPEDSRRALSIKLCQAWGWVQPNGALRDGVCRQLLLALHRAGHIELPPPRCRGVGAGVRQPPTPVPVDQSPLVCSLAELGPLRLRQVRRTSDEPLLDGLLAAHHYLGAARPVGENLKFLVFAGERPVAGFVWSSAPRHLAPRDDFIGWTPKARRRNLRFLAYNSRFLIPPWVRVPNLASHVLGRMARELPALWDEGYGHPVYFAETFVDPRRFRGTCYRAANWRCLGETTGRGKDDQTHRPNRPIKDVLGLPLCRRFRELLTRGA